MTVCQSNRIRAFVFFSSIQLFVQIGWRKEDSSVSTLRDLCLHVSRMCLPQASLKRVGFIYMYMFSTLELSWVDLVSWGRASSQTHYLALIWLQRINYGCALLGDEHVDVDGYSLQQAQFIIWKECEFRHLSLFVTCSQQFILYIAISQNCVFQQMAFCILIHGILLSKYYIFKAFRESLT